MMLVSSLVAGAVGGGIGYWAANATDQGTITSASAPLVQPALATGSNGTAASNDIEAVAKAVLPSVVKINVAGPQGAGSGSGIIITASGEILTNNHVVELAGNGGSIIVNFNDGTTVRAHVVGTDPVTDVAVIQADGVSGLTPATLGSSSSLQVGQPVVAIGSPFGLEATVTSGIVSSLNRPVSVNGNGTNVSYPAIQTDAAINPGNSGGPLVNLSGQVVGIDSSIFTDTQSLGSQGGSIGLGFAIPIDNILPIVNQIRAGQAPTHARLGVEVRNASEQGGLVTGAGIAQVMSGTAAEAAGLQVGDVITEVDGQQVTDATSLVAAIHGYRPGVSVSLTVDRGGKTLTLHATLGNDAKGA
jgi:putative serine protease PepD